MPLQAAGKPTGSHERLNDCLLRLRAGDPSKAPLFAVTSLDGTATMFAPLSVECDVYAIQHEHMSTGGRAALGEASLPELALKYAQLILEEVARRPSPCGFHLIGVSFGSFLAHHIAVAAHSLGVPAAGLVLLEPWPVPPLSSIAVGADAPQQAAGVIEIFTHGLLGAPAVDEEEVFAAYASQPDDGLGLLVAERLTAMHLQPFTTANVLKASRQVHILVHHARLWSVALAAPLRPLPGATRVLMAVATDRDVFFARMFGCSPQESDPQHLRRFYGAALASELLCDGSHLQVGVRCATNREPAFTARLKSFLEAMPAQRSDVAAALPPLMSEAVWDGGESDDEGDVFFDCSEDVAQESEC